MLFKFLIVTALTTRFFLSSDATCSKWVKLNKSPVCFGAKGFTVHRNMFVSSFMLVHRSGNISCNARVIHLFSYWGCAPNHGSLLTLLTDQKNNILAPEASSVHRKSGAYSLAGFTSSSSALVFCAAKKPHCVFAKSQLRIWYGEDLFGITESDNGGRTCADVYALIV